jgi:hypothetical protein
MLTVIKETEHCVLPSGQTNRVFLCKCDCGNETKVKLLHLVRNRIISCGCLIGEKHGDSNSKLYKLWRAVKWRCNKNYFQNQFYSGKNITICDEWNSSYLAFKEWALNNGYKQGLQIDRIDNAKGYFPENCRFATIIENANNKDNTVYISYKGQRLAFMDALRIKGLDAKESTIRQRLNSGWEVEKAIDTPIKKGNYKTKPMV